VLRRSDSSSLRTWSVMGVRARSRRTKGLEPAERWRSLAPYLPASISSWRMALARAASSIAAIWSKGNCGAPAGAEALTAGRLPESPTGMGGVVPSSSGLPSGGPSAARAMALPATRSSVSTSVTMPSSMSFCAKSISCASRPTAFRTPTACSRVNILPSTQSRMSQRISLFMPEGCADAFGAGNFCKKRLRHRCRLLPARCLSRELRASPDSRANYSAPFTIL